MADSKVNAPSSAYKAMLPDWQLVLDLMGGTRAMREAGERHLPRHPRETKREYRARLNRTFLFNFFSKVVGSLAAKPFGKPVRLGDASPQELRVLTDDVDRQGHDVTAWARPVFADGLAKGFTHFLVDFPEVDPKKVQTLEDEQRAGARPYFVHIPAESLVAAYAEVVDGVEHLTHVRIHESEVRRKGYDEVTVQRIRVLEPDKWEVFERTEDNAWKSVASGTNQLGFIPLVTWYAGERKGLMQTRPPLLDLAHKNVEHWQSSSDQRHVLTVARFPMLAASGITLPSGGEGQGDDGPSENRGKLTIGPSTLLTTENPQGKFYYVEHTGAAIAAGRQDLEDLKDEMAALGIELLVKRSGTPTATETSINEAKSQSELQAMAESFGDALELGFHYAAKWLKIQVPDASLKVQVHTDFGLTEQDKQDLDVLFKARAAREISREAFLGELKRRGVLAPDFDATLDAESLGAEGPALGTFRPAPSALGAGRAPGAGQVPGAGPVVPAGGAA
ncbi:DUF4055 domain-containing protein [Myxococcus sp. MxC21-1]|uniref:DUF4055 domain-containing protein n=1 Tax=Myxococcus sp. MxC21-1 TaxID=3041439 RepID=UPI00292CDE6B|nr:DUF4055 domain-containing protein [Myxococcus sp. MxC21-1]WNZ59917.1 DUF4055 domain-containing protein [Myxococcus sp. MxC21-1]